MVVPVDLRSVSTVSQNTSLPIVHVLSNVAEVERRGLCSPANCVLQGGSRFLIHQRPSIGCTADQVLAIGRRYEGLQLFRRASAVACKVQGQRAQPAFPPDAGRGGVAVPMFVGGDMVADAEQGANVCDRDQFDLDLADVVPQAIGTLRTSESNLGAAQRHSEPAAEDEVADFGFEPNGEPRGVRAGIPQIMSA